MNKMVPKLIRVKAIYLNLRPIVLKNIYAFRYHISGSLDGVLNVSIANPYSAESLYNLF